MIQRVLRGGSYDDVSRYLRATNRDWNSPEFRSRWNGGFRLVVRRKK